MIGSLERKNGNAETWILREEIDIARRSKDLA